MTAAAHFRRFVAFAAVGLVGTAAHYLTLTGLVELGGIDPVAGSVAGFIVGAAVNYTLNYRLTFRSHKSHREAATKFFAVAASGFVINAALMHVLVNLADLPYLLAQVGVTGFLVFWHYALNALWTFR